MAAAGQSIQDGGQVLGEALDFNFVGSGGCQREWWRSGSPTDRIEVDDQVVGGGDGDAPEDEEGIDFGAVKNVAERVDLRQLLQPEGDAFQGIIEFAALIGEGEGEIIGQGDAGVGGRVRKSKSMFSRYSEKPLTSSLGGAGKGGKAVCNWSTNCLTLFWSSLACWMFSSLG